MIMIISALSAFLMAGFMPAIHTFPAGATPKNVDAIGTRACPSSALSTERRKSGKPDLIY
jgi:hypothetical protein